MARLLLVVLVLSGFGPALGQEPVEPGAPAEPPAAEAPWNERTAPDRKVFSLGLLAGGGDGNGGGIGLRAGLGGLVGESLRLDASGTIHGSTRKNGAAEFMVGRMSVELVASTRLGALRPFLGAGWQRATVSLDYAGEPTDLCIPGTIVCAPGDWRSGAFETEEWASGPVVSVGAALGITDSVLVGLEVRKPFIDRIASGPLYDVPLGSPTFHLTAVWRAGGK
jgi:hypothetical protein